jgi:hypothetical protein
MKYDYVLVSVNLIMQSIDRLPRIKGHVTRMDVLLRNVEVETSEEKLPK